MFVCSRSLRYSVQSERHDQRQDRRNQEGEAGVDGGRGAHVRVEGDLPAEAVGEGQSPQYCQVILGGNTESLGSTIFYGSQDMIGETGTFCNINHSANMQI